MNYFLEQKIKEVLDELPPGQQNNFKKCISDIQYGNYRYISNSDDAFSAVIENNRSCIACRQAAKKELRDKIDNCIQLLIDNYKH